MLRIERTAHDHRVEPQAQVAKLNLLRIDRHDLERDLVVARHPVAIEAELEFLATLADEILLQERLPVGANDQPAAIEIEEIVLVALARREVDDELILARMLDAMRFLESGSKRVRTPRNS